MSSTSKDMKEFEETLHRSLYARTQAEFRGLEANGDMNDLIPAIEDLLYNGPAKTEQDIINRSIMSIFAAAIKSSRDDSHRMNEKIRKLENKIRVLESKVPDPET
jgi:hypothetical protein